MRKQIVAGNWKMNLTLEEAKALAAGLKVKMDNRMEALSGDETTPEVVLFPPYVYITRLLDMFVGYSGISIGAQNCHHEEQGAYTGEVSAAMIRSLGASHVIVGHSERRKQFQEDDAMLAQKVQKVLKNGMTPVFCCGELLPDREKGNHFMVVTDQILKGLLWLGKEQFERVVVAYEPVWAIGTGVTASPDQAQEMHAHIRKLLADTYGDDIAENTTILYGGSCSPKNAAELFSQPDVDGGLIGGASLKAGDFYQIIDSFTS